jgi:hypothetical protein
MFNQLDMVLKVLPEYAEQAASKLRASGEHVLSPMGPLILPPITPARNSGTQLAVESLLLCCRASY